MRGTALRAAVLAREPAPRDLLISVERALAVLETIALSPRPIPAKAVAQWLGISLGTSYRVLHTLEHGGYVVRLGHGCFGLGGKITSLSRLFQESLDLVRDPPAHPRAARRRGGGGHLPRASSAEARSPSRRWSRGRASCMSAGSRSDSAAWPTHPPSARCSWPHAPTTTIDDYLGQQPLRALTPRTLVRRRHIKSDLHTVREAGVAHDLEEMGVGCCCVAAPVRDAHGAVVGSVGLSTPTERWRREEAHLTRLCASAAAQANGARPLPSRPEIGQECLSAHPEAGIGSSGRVRDGQRGGGPCAD